MGEMSDKILNYYRYAVDELGGVFLYIAAPLRFDTVCVMNQFQITQATQFYNFEHQMVRLSLVTDQFSFDVYDNTVTWECLLLTCDSTLRIHYVMASRYYQYI